MSETPSIIMFEMNAYSALQAFAVAGFKSSGLRNFLKYTPRLLPSCHRDHLVSFMHCATVIQLLLQQFKVRAKHRDGHVNHAGKTFRKDRRKIALFFALSSGKNEYRFPIYLIRRGRFIHLSRCRQKLLDSATINAWIFIKEPTFQGGLPRKLQHRRLLILSQLSLTSETISK
jgi:hypothetical protein